jgi:hypothetical protein
MILVCANGVTLMLNFKKHRTAALNTDYIEDSNVNGSMVFIVSGALGAVIIILLLTMGVFAIGFSLKKSQLLRKST